MDTGAIATHAKGIEIYVMSSAIGLARMSGLVLVMPVFLRMGLQGVLRAGVALVLALPLLPFIAATFPFDQISAGPFAAILFKEVMVGLTIGIILGIPIWAAEAAGEFLDLQRGINFGDMIDASLATTNNITGTLFSLIVVAIFFASGGLNITIRTVYESYSLWPLTNFLPVFREGSGPLFLNLLDELFSMGLMLVVPIVIALLLSDLSLALIARAAPHMNIFVLSLTVKNLVFALLLVLYATFLLGYMRDDLGWLSAISQRLEPFAPK
jgi:type III secretion protein T